MEKLIQDIREYYEVYKGAQNTATASRYDANANVVQHGFPQWNAEATKKINYKYNMSLIEDKIEELFGAERRQEFISDRDNHLIYIHDAKSHVGISPYCCSISMYPFLFGGMKKIDGFTETPKHLESFCGAFCNLIYYLAAEYKGAIATPELFTYFEYFLRIDYGEDWMSKLELLPLIKSKFQFLVYTLNQPAGGRGCQSVFWNVAYFDKTFFESLFENFVFPDGSEPNWDGVNKLQKIFMVWFNKERNRADLTFPVETFNLIVDKNKKFIDTDNFDFVCKQYAEGHSFFTYISDSVDSLSSCCRLKSAIKNKEFSFTLGAGGIQIGSACVMTINLNRLIQTNEEDWQYELTVLAERITDYQSAYRELLRENIEAGMFANYTAGFMRLEKQYMTTGINGVVQAAEFLGLECSDNKEYQEFVNQVTGILKLEHMKENKLIGPMGQNTEMTPCEGLGINNLLWDREDGLLIREDETAYNSYFFRPEDNISIWDKIRLHGEAYIQNLDGGSACHANLEEHLDAEQYQVILEYAAKVGCSYLTFNIPNTVCNDCGYRSKHYFKDECPMCGSDNLDWLTRVIGYLRRISNFAAGRQAEAHERHYSSVSQILEN